MKTFSPTLRLCTIAIALAALANVGTALAAAQEFKMKPLRFIQAETATTEHIMVKLRSMQPAFMAREIHANSLHNLSATAGIPLTMHRPMTGGAHVLKLPKRMLISEAEAYVKSLQSHPDVEYAEVSHRRQAELVPNDEYYAGKQITFKLSGASFFAQQWYLNDPIGGVNAPAAWDITTGDPNLRIAVLDTGIAPHSDMTGRTSGGYDMIANALFANDGSGKDADPSDPGDFVTTIDMNNPAFAICGIDQTAIDAGSSWHGTSVAGIIGAKSNNLNGIAGINWNSLITPVRVLGKCGGDDFDIVDAIRYAAGVSNPVLPVNPNPARVINLSLGGPNLATSPTTCPKVYVDAFADAAAKGAVVVAAAGNGDANGNGIDASTHAPGGSCAGSGIITVAATGQKGELGSYSNFGTTITISAPGGNQYNPSTFDGTIWHIINNGKTTPDSLTVLDASNYAAGEGTSFAAPVVSGVVSLMLSVNPNLTPAQVIDILRTTARSFPAVPVGLIQCTTAKCGAGIINAAAAVAKAKSLATGPTPTPSPTPTPTPVPLQPTININLNPLAFPATPLGASSALQVNYSTTASNLVISSIAITTDFSITQNTCGLNPPPNVICPMQITFKPSVLGNRSGTLTITDNAVGSPHVISLSGLATSDPIPTPTPTPTPTPNQSSGGGGCAMGSANDPADFGLPLLLSAALLWRARRRTFINR